MSERVRMSWKVWVFKACEEYDLPCGCVGVFRKVEKEPGVCEYVVCCPRRIYERQAQVVFEGVWDLRHTKGKGPGWYVMRSLLLEQLPDAGFEECEHRAGEFVVPRFKPGPTPRSSKVKEKDPGPCLKRLNITI